MAEFEERMNRIEKNLDKLTIMVLDVVESVKRLDRVSGVLLINDDELDRRLSELKGKPQRRPLQDADIDEDCR